MSGSRSILVVGTGSIGERHLRCFAETGRVQVSICEINPELRQTVGERYGVEARFGDLDSALATKPDAVVICTPAHLHIAMAQKAAEAGAHLLIEKPLSVDFNGIDRLQMDVSRRDLKVAVAYVYRVHPALAGMREAILSGKLGEPVQVVACSGQNFPFYRPAYRDTYYRNRAHGGGAVQDALTHVINAVEWLVGPAERLVADLDHKLVEGVEVEDTVHVLTRHGDVMGCFSLNQHQAANEGTITVICSGGTARFEYHENRWRWVTEPGEVWHDEAGGTIERDELFVRQASKFLDYLDGSARPLCSLEEGLGTLKVNRAILESATTGGWVRVEG